MSQDSKVLSRAFLGIGLILLVISAIIFITSSPIAKTRFIQACVIVDTVFGTPVTFSRHG